MEIKDRAISARDSLARRRLEHKLESAREDKAELSIENKELEDRSRHDRDEIDRILDTLQRVSAKGKTHRVRRLTTLAIAAGGAYVLGAKAGRERFDQINSWWHRIRGDQMRPMDEVLSDVRESVENAADTIAS